MFIACGYNLNNGVTSMDITIITTYPTICASTLININMEFEGPKRQGNTIMRPHFATLGN